MSRGARLPGSETAQDQIGWDLRYASLPTFYRFARHLRTQHSIKYLLHYSKLLHYETRSSRIQNIRFLNHRKTKPMPILKTEMSDMLILCLFIDFVCWCCKDQQLHLGSCWQAGEGEVMGSLSL